MIALERLVESIIPYRAIFRSPARRVAFLVYYQILTSPLRRKASVLTHQAIVLPFYILVDIQPPPHSPISVLDSQLVCTVSSGVFTITKWAV